MAEVTGHNADYILNKMPLHKALGYVHAWHLLKGRVQVWPEVVERQKSSIMQQMDAAFTDRHTHG